MRERVPRTTGEVLSDSIAMMRRHFKVFYLLALPFCAANLILRESGQSAFAVLQNLDPTKLDAGSLGTIFAALGGGAALWFAAQLAVVLASVASTSLAAAGWAGRAPTVEEALKAIATRGAATVVTSLLLSFGLAAVFLPAVIAAGVAVAIQEPVVIIGAVVLGALAVVAFVFLFLRWSLATQAIVLEDRIALDALGRSGELMASRGLPLLDGPKFRMSILYFIVFAISGPLQSLFTVPRLIMAFAGGWTFGEGFPPLASMPLWFIVIFGLLEVATTALIVPFIGVLFTLFYYDLRVRFEALDLDVDAVPPGPPSSPSSPSPPQPA